jgi:hypothetical protein
MHMHAIGVPEGVTLLEFEGTCQEEQEAAPVQEIPTAGVEEGEGVVLECPNHEPATFVKGKPRSIISLLLYEIN